MIVGPFDRLNDRAKRVFALSQDEAIRFNHNYIGVEHLLLGLVREGEGVAARTLGSLGVDLRKTRTAVESIIGRGDTTTVPSEIVLHPRTRKVLELAIDEARKLDHGDVGTEHLLLGLVREGSSAASGVLESLGVSLEQVRHQVIAFLGQRRAAAQAGMTAGPTSRAQFQGEFGPAVVRDRLDTSARRALARAYWEAGHLNHEQVGPEHLVLALIANDSAWIRRVLTELDVDLAGLARILDLAPREGARPASLTEASSLHESIDRAALFAAERSSALVRPEHLLLAIASGPGIAAMALASVGATPERLRTAIDKMSG